MLAYPRVVALLQPDNVSNLLREAAETEVLPRFRNLSEGEVREKSPGELVTAADEAMERRLADGLVALLPGSVVVGEEASSANPSLLDLLSGEAPVWVVDPLDGTANFAAGSPVFGTMVCLVRQGATVAAWIYLPVEGGCLVAERGSGAWLDGTRVEAGPAARPLRVSLNTKFFPPLHKEHIEATRPLFDIRPSSHCAAMTYTQLARGELDVALYYRLMPWDHAPGVLVYQEAGGSAALLNGAPYSALVHSGGLLLAPDVETWQRLAALFRAPAL